MISQAWSLLRRSAASYGVMDCQPVEQKGVRDGAEIAGLRGPLAPGNAVSDTVRKFDGFRDQQLLLTLAVQQCATRNVTLRKSCRNVNFATRCPGVALAVR